MKGESASVVTSSTRRPRRSSSRSERASSRLNDFEPAENSTSTSISLSGRASSLSTEPNKARRSTPSARISCSDSRRRRTASSRSSRGGVMSSIYRGAPLAQSTTRGLTPCASPAAAAAAGYGPGETNPDDATSCSQAPESAAADRCMRLLGGPGSGLTSGQAQPELSRAQRPRPPRSG